MQRTITISPVEEKNQNRLRKTIAQKKDILKNLTTKVEGLRMDLELIQHEYNVRIGALLLKDNQLDIEIIQLKNLKRLIEEGMTYIEAMKAEEDKFYNEILRMQKEQEKLEEEKRVLDRRIDVSEIEQEAIKTLWKKLIRQFHPDLVVDPVIKKEREEIVKKINKAYSENDYSVLKALENNTLLNDKQYDTQQRLEEILVELENLILHWKEEFIILKNSEWFVWREKIKKAKQTGADVFAQFEKNLLNDITKKITLVRELREEVHGDPNFV